MTSRPRNYNGSEGKNLWTQRYGQKAGQAPMVTRVGMYDGSGDSTIDISGNYTLHNILVHSIRVVNTTNDDDIVIKLMDGHTGTDDKFRVVVNRMHKAHNVVNFDFPIPILLTNGGRVNHDASGCLTSICYTILNSTTAIPNAESIFLQTAYHFQDAAEADKYRGNDCEILGVYLCHNGEGNTGSEYAKLHVKTCEATPSNCAVVAINENTDLASTGHDNYEPEPNTTPWFFPYPVYSRGGFRMVHSSDGADNLYSAVFYRVVPTHDVDYGWV